jgi:hypothetical protein
MTPPKIKVPTINWQIGPAFFAILLQLIVGAFGAGMIYFRLDANVSKVDTLSAKVDAAQEREQTRFGKLDIFVSELKSANDYMLARITRLETKTDGGKN